MLYGTGLIADLMTIYGTHRSYTFRVIQLYYIDIVCTKVQYRGLGDIDMCNIGDYGTQRGAI